MINFLLVNLIVIKLHFNLQDTFLLRESQASVVREYPHDRNSAAAAVTKAHIEKNEGAGLNGETSRARLESR